MIPKSGSGNLLPVHLDSKNHWNNAQQLNAAPPPKRKFYWFVWMFSFKKQLSNSEANSVGQNKSSFIICMFGILKTNRKMRIHGKSRPSRELEGTRFFVRGQLLRQSQKPEIRFLPELKNWTLCVGFLFEWTMCIYKRPRQENGVKSEHRDKGRLTWATSRKNRKPSSLPSAVSKALAGLVWSGCLEKVPTSAAQAVPPWLRAPCCQRTLQSFLAGRPPSSASNVRLGA